MLQQYDFSCGSAALATLLDMKNFLEARGFQADGFQQPLGKLAEAGIPSIVLISEVGDLARVTPEQAAVLSRQAAAINPVQNGPGNASTLNANDLATPGTVIQNTSSNQNIQRHGAKNRGSIEALKLYIDGVSWKANWLRLPSAAISPRSRSNNKIKKFPKAFKTVSVKDSYLPAAAT